MNININDIINQIDCYLISCNSEYKEMTVEKNKAAVACILAINAYHNNKITKKECIDTIMKINSIHINSDYFEKFAKCALKNCYEKIEKIFDAIIIFIKYKKPKKYTIKDWRNITTEYIKKQTIEQLL